MKSRYPTHKTKNGTFRNTLVATVLLANGFFLVSPVLAQTTPTAAGTSIDNQATATYEDPNNPNIPINATSNTVTISIAEVAGILVQAGTPVDNNGGTIQTGDLIYFPFTITNIGNDPTRFQIPTQAGITGPGTQGTLQYSTDGTTWTDVPTGGFTTVSIPVNGTIQVRVPVTVNSGVTPGQTIKVTLGETNPAETNSNSPRAGSINDARDIYTVDNADGTQGEVTGVPANGVVEGSAAATITIAPKYYSLATILKTRGTYSNSNTPTDITDDTINYGLSLQVRSTDNTGQNITPSALAGSVIPGLTGTNILVSDAIPFGTQLAAIPTAPTGWTVVYSTTPVTTSANAATWTTTAPADLSTVTRIGFAKTTVDGNTSTYLAAADAQSTSFSIQVKVKTGQTAPLTIANIAQVFGKTPETNAPVFDESGDINPSNFDGTPNNMTPSRNVDTDGDNVPDKLPDVVPDGYITDPKTDPTDLNNTGTDTNGNNTGSGTDGEANVFTISLNALVNGPNGFPDAVGPNNNNDDFTNKSSNVPAGLTPGSTFNPNAVTFTNTILNTGSLVANISLLPTPPATPSHLPNGTTVTITVGSSSATYTYNGTVFTFTSGTGFAAGNPISATNPLQISALATNTQSSYTVTVDLPAGTPLSTDPGLERGFPVPITAFIDANGDGVSNNNEVANITIDRVYTGFLQLIKQSRILQGTGPAVQGTDGTLSTTPKKPAPGNIVEYVIQYRNISEPQPANGNNNVILNASNVVITEDGTLAPNNWAVDNAPTNNVIDTSHVLGSVQAAGTIQFFGGTLANTVGSEQSGTTAATDITKYVNTLSAPVTPGQTGTFIFQRKVN
ncbi:hypothetical protein H6G80_27795 [Nostoc sp. FACHB-87]|uniref:beta strand repeat-containing protein n=1 Tax=Nostocaceae TaxID=1162 RepID=UPI0016847AE0|nr:MULTISPECIES: hypothetical protein [Nostocaceae]MBD2457856.1 hypothetical protein [Nostoc sp. FACHB-87]MBD2474608.1 hypothetical protein [Anabaena sp. FACHB-83]